jgi:hypothetical protein
LTPPRSELTHWLLADWIEIRLLFGDSATISFAALIDELVEEATFSDLGVYDETYSDDLTSDDGSSVRRAQRIESAEGANPEALLVDETLAELERRATIVGGSYPITVATGVARLAIGSWRDAPAYAFLTALNARFIWSLKADLHIGARLFERLVVPALRSYWGGEALHFGWPRDSAEDGPFRAAFPRYMAQLGERLNVTPQELPLAQKDLGVDVVAWRPLDDRPGKSVLLCQCAIGEDWDSKGVPIEKWQTLVNFAVRPIPGLAFPFVPEATRLLTQIDWLLLCAAVGVPLDRLRLARLLGESRLEPQLLGQLIAWTEQLAPKLGIL